jgi:hypothetical protein
MVTATGLDAIPLATTSIVLAPASAVAGTSNMVETLAPPVATAIAACITLALVAMAPRHVRDQQYTRRGTVQVVNHSPDPRKTGG